MKTVCISIKLLYNEFGENLTFCKIKFTPKGEENEHCEYYDLQDNNGNILCMDGEECEILDSSNNVVLKNLNGEISTEFILSNKEYLIATLN